MSEEPLFIILKNVMGPSFFLWKWTREDYEIPARFKVDGTEVVFRFTVEDFFNKDKPLPNRQMPMRCSILIKINQPPKEFVDGLRFPNGEYAEATARHIYHIYEETLKKITLYGRWVVKSQSITDSMTSRFDEIFFERGILSMEHVYWKLGQGDFVPFFLKPKKRTGKINPIFKSKNLLTPTKWKKLGEYAISDPEIEKDVEELVRIRAKTTWGERRIPTIETAALVEVAIRKKVSIILKERGQSRRKVGTTSKDVGLSTLLNIILPLILTKSEMKKNKKYLDSLDVLRSIRNDIMHDNIPEDKIDSKLVKEGVDAAIHVVHLLNSKV